MRARISFAAAMTLAALPAFAAGSNSVSVRTGALAVQVLALIEPLVPSLLGVTLTWLLAKLGPAFAKSCMPHTSIGKSNAPSKRVSCSSKAPRKARFSKSPSPTR